MDEIYCAFFSGKPSKMEIFYWMTLWKCSLLRLIFIPMLMK